MSGAGTTCSRCGAALEAGACPACRADEPIEDARRRLEETRERLGQWRERLSRRLTEYERKREILAAADARRLSRAPTVDLDAGSRRPASPPADDDPFGLMTEPTVVGDGSRAAVTGEGDANPVEAGHGSAAGPAESSADDPLATGAAGDEEAPEAATMVLGSLSEVLGNQPSPFAPDHDDALGTAPTVLTNAGFPAPDAGDAPEPPADSPPPSPFEFPPPSPPPSPLAPAEPESAESPFAEPASAPPAGDHRDGADHLVSPDPAEPDRPWTPSAWAHEGTSIPAGESASDAEAATTSLASDAEPGTDSRAEPAAGEDAATRHTAIRVEAGHATATSPSLARRAASLVLDLLLLLVLPAAIVTGPIAYLGLGRTPADLWTGSGGLLLPFFLLLFILLEALYLGAFGRTPGLRLAGLQVVDERGAVPSFGLALLRSLTFPIVLIPVLEGVSRTRTVGEP